MDDSSGAVAKEYAMAGGRVRHCKWSAGEWVTFRDGQCVDESGREAALSFREAKGWKLLVRSRDELCEDLQELNMKLDEAIKRAVAAEQALLAQEPPICDVCGEEDSDEQAFGKVEVCRACYSAAQYAIDLAYRQGSEATVRSRGTGGECDDQTLQNSEAQIDDLTEARDKWHDIAQTQTLRAERAEALQQHTLRRLELEQERAAKLYAALETIAYDDGDLDRLAVAELAMRTIIIDNRSTSGEATDA